MAIAPQFRKRTHLRAETPTLRDASGTKVFVSSQDGKPAEFGVKPLVSIRFGERAPSKTAKTRTAELTARQARKLAANC